MAAGHGCARAGGGREGHSAPERRPAPDAGAGDGRAPGETRQGGADLSGPAVAYGRPARGSPRGPARPRPVRDVHTHGAKAQRPEHRRPRATDQRAGGRAEQSGEQRHTEARAALPGLQETLRQGLGVGPADVRKGARAHGAQLPRGVGRGGQGFLRLHRPEERRQPLLQLGFCSGLALALPSRLGSRCLLACGGRPGRSWAGLQTLRRWRVQTWKAIAAQRRQLPDGVLCRRVPSALLPPLPESRCGLPMALRPQAWPIELDLILRSAIVQSTCFRGGRSLLLRMAE
mmetsp:Transcript_37643/g.108011  ORF Transcript_37643/g.108011 Transcript_37643/m.108011 type:complete len:288 (-) Transcript_37643:58-921(-)